MLVGLQRLLHTSIPQDPSTEGAITKNPTTGFLSLCQTSIDLELSCGTLVLEHFLSSLSPEVCASVQSIIIQEYTLLHLGYLEESNHPSPIQYLNCKLPQLKVVEVFSEYNVTDQYSD